VSEQEHAQAIRIASATDRELSRLFARLGTSRHPRGRILTAYRQARRALAGGERIDLRIANEVLAELRLSVEEVAVNSLRAAAEAGNEQARRMAALYSLPGVSPPLVQDAELTAWMATYDAQAAQVRALAMSGEKIAIIGDDNRVGTLSPSPIVRDGARWLVIAAIGGLSHGINGAISRSGRQGEFVRQAVAAIDGRTTNCCLKVHGQVVEMEESFRLTGTPRFADKMRDPPFHSFCRTVWTLILRNDINDALTAQMRNAAAAELADRAEYGDTTSRRYEDYTPSKNIPGTRTTSAISERGLLDSWVSGAHYKKSILLKNAIREEFGQKGLLLNRNNYQISADDIRAARPVVRSIYNDTQDALRGKRSVKLYRGVKSSIRTPGVVESWTTDIGTARKFNGYDVIEMEIPVERIFAFSGGPNWKNGRYGEQFEYMVMSEEPQ